MGFVYIVLGLLLSGVLHEAIQYSAAVTTIDVMISHYHYYTIARRGGIWIGWVVLTDWIPWGELCSSVTEV